MRWLVPVLLLAVLSIGSANAQGAGSIVAWGKNYADQSNVPAPNAALVAPAASAPIGVGSENRAGSENLDIEGACCFLDGNCTITTQAGCSGLWWYQGIVCSPNPCPQLPLGVCCDALSMCMMTRELGCNGDWTIGGTCTPNTCPPPTGACCSLDGFCSETIEAECDHDWRGAATTCPPTPGCPPSGRCCASDGGCTLSLQEHCTGTWIPGTVCSPNPCPQPGACCAPDGSCSLTVQSACSGTWRNTGTTCSPNPCQSGAGVTAQWGAVSSARLVGHTTYMWYSEAADSSVFPPASLPLHIELPSLGSGLDDLVWAQGTVGSEYIDLASHWWTYHGNAFGTAEWRAERARAFTLAGVSGKVRVRVPVTLSGDVSSGSHAQWTLWVGGLPSVTGVRSGGDAFTLTPEWTGVLRSGEVYSFGTTLVTAGGGTGGEASCSLFLPSSLQIAYAQQPLIQQITDVPGDQGRNVRIRWWKSSGDDPDSARVSGYAIYRAEAPGRAGIPGLHTPIASTFTPIEQGSGEEIVGLRRLAGWDYITTVPVRGDSLYQTVVPALCDSTVVGGTCWSVFFISALTSNPYVFFDSPPDSGYSVDNLAPGIPRNLRFTVPSLLVWDEASEPDFDYFSIYGSSSPVFDDDAVLVAHATGTTQDVAGLPYRYLHVAATDFAGNQGETASIASPLSGSDLEAADPTGIALHAPIPNPSAGGVVFTFDLLRGSDICLRIFDSAGRMRVDLERGFRSAGRHTVSWRGTDAGGALLPSGVYFCRLQAGSLTQTRRLLLAR